MTDKAKTIITAKRNCGPGSYLWVHTSGDVILWSDEDSSVNDNGAHAVERWDVDTETVDALIDSGECDELT
jgi:hypothetical protein